MGSETRSAFLVRRLCVVDGTGEEFLSPVGRREMRENGHTVVVASMQPSSEEEWRKQKERNLAMRASGTNGRGSKD